MSIEAVKRWLDEIVIGQNFCPFARFVRDNEQIRFVENSSLSQAEVLTKLHEEVRLLESNDTVATTLIVLSNGFTDFNDYLDLLDMCNELIEQWGYAGRYQIASFHPDYEFEGEPKDSASHYTNRAPFPVLHLLREHDIEAVLKHYPNPEHIYETNMRRSQELGIKWFQQKLAAYRAC